MSAIVDEILTLFRTRGSEPYGEDVSVADHCLQCAALARARSAPDSLIAAALLHDVGHLIEVPDDGYGVHRHDRGGAEYLRPHFPDAVVEPVRLHVEAKRYRVAVEPSYMDALSQASQHTLRHQGGPMSDDEVRVFEDNPHHRDALLLREWDDHGKVAGLDVVPLDAYRPLLETLAVAD